MSDPLSGKTTTGLVYEDTIPMRCSVVSMPDPAQLARLHEANEEVLRVMSALDEHPPEITDDHPDVAHELRRLDFKFNLLLDLVSQVVARHLDLPERIAVRVVASGVEWQTKTPPAPNSIVQLEMYLSTKFPRPLVLLGRTADVEKHPDGARVVVLFEGMSEMEGDWLEKIIFVHHRRQIAHARRQHHH